MNRVVVLSAFLAAAFAAAPAGAQPSPLKGMSGVQVLAEDTDANDAKCGVVKADLVSTASKALLDAGVKVVDSARATLNLSLITLTIEPEGMCVSHLGLSLRSFAFGSLAHAPDTKLTFEATLQQQRTLFSSARAEHGARLRDRVRSLTERIAKEIQAANQ